VWCFPNSISLHQRQCAAVSIGMSAVVARSVCMGGAAPHSLEGNQGRPRGARPDVVSIIVADGTIVIMSTSVCGCTNSSASSRSCLVLGFHLHPHLLGPYIFSIVHQCKGSYLYLHSHNRLRITLLSLRNLTTRVSQVQCVLASCEQYTSTLISAEWIDLCNVGVKQTNHVGQDGRGHLCSSDNDPTH
jgi:hypothetical protein